MLPGRPVRDGLADGLIDVAERVAVEERPVLVDHAPVHGVAGVDVLGHGVLEEADGGGHLDVTGVHGVLIDHAPHAAQWSACECEYTTATTGRSPRCSATSSMAAAAVSLIVSGSNTIQPLSPQTKVMLARSQPRTW